MALAISAMQLHWRHAFLEARSAPDLFRMHVVLRIKTMRMPHGATTVNTGPIGTGVDSIADKDQQNPVGCVIVVTTKASGERPAGVC